MIDTIKNTKVVLKSDFLDYYDHWFDRDGLEFERYSQQGMSRREMFKYLFELGLRMPPFGTPQEVFNQLDGQMKDMEAMWRDSCEHDLQVVIYLDEQAHRGEGKLKLPLHQAVAEYPDHLCSLFIPPSSSKARSLRYLQIGERRFWLEYLSSNDWRSNCGDVVINVLTEAKGYHPLIHYPLFAVDFVANTPNSFAVDFNISPGINRTGIEFILPAKEAAHEIKQAVLHFQKDVLAISC